MARHRRWRGAKPGEAPKGMKSAALWYSYRVMGYSWEWILYRWGTPNQDQDYIMRRAAQWAALYEQPWPPRSPMVPYFPEEKTMTPPEAEEDVEAAEYDKSLDPLGFMVKEEVGDESV